MTFESRESCYCTLYTYLSIHFCFIYENGRSMASRIMPIKTISPDGRSCRITRIGRHRFDDTFFYRFLLISYFWQRYSITWATPFFNLRPLNRWEGKGRSSMQALSIRCACNRGLWLLKLVQLFCPVEQQIQQPWRLVCTSLYCPYLNRLANGGDTAERSEDKDTGLSSGVDVAHRFLHDRKWIIHAYTSSWTYTEL